MANKALPPVPLWPDQGPYNVKNLHESMWGTTLNISQGLAQLLWR